MDATWTLETLTQRIDAVLRQEGIHQHNGQVAEAPNARAIRWYQSTGLLRRPEQRGRVAFYGPAHLAEVVAIKRLQATGLSLVDVQARLHDLGDDALFSLANIPAELADEVHADASTHDADSVVVRRSFWDDDVADAAVVPFVAPEPEAVPLTTRQIVDHPSGVSLVLPHTIDAAVASMMLRRLVDELVAGGHLPTTSPAPDATNGAATREKP
jgi:DNA-binding transcriptional MerR regulator